MLNLTCLPRIDPTLLHKVSRKEKKRIIYSCLSKRRFLTLERASDALNKSVHLAPAGSKPLPAGYAFNVYLCPYCSGYHIGRKLTPQKDSQ